MLGMLQILTYLLCLYLVFKGFEILQIALVSVSPKRSAGMAIGIIAVILSILAAVGFGFLATIQAGSASSH